VGAVCRSRSERAKYFRTLRGRREAHLAEHGLDAPKPGQVRRARLYLQLVKALRDSSAIEHGYAVINEFGKLPAAGFSQGPAAAYRPQSGYAAQFLLTSICDGQ